MHKDLYFGRRFFIKHIQTCKGYFFLLNLKWLTSLGGIKAIEEINEKKAQLFYSEIDINPLFKGYAVKEDRSMMNATFNLNDKKLEPLFNQLLEDANINGLNGHRSVGGYRASMYNALPLSSVETLVEVMNELERKA